MDKYDVRYDIRLAKIDEIEECMDFIDKHWSKGHIMSIDRKLFEYEFRAGEYLNIIIAKDRQTNCIEGFFGFIPCSYSDDSKKDVWGSMWKVNSENDNIPLLGIEIAKRVYSITNCRMHIGNGANPQTTIPLRKLFFKEKTDKMRQFYLLNDACNDFKIAKIENKWKPVLEYDNEQADLPSTVLKRYDSVEELKTDFDIDLCDTIPYKDSVYFHKRYFRHPYYQYQVYGIQKESKVDAVFVTRIVKCNDSHVLRIVDYYGNHQSFSTIGKHLYNMMKYEGYESIDFFEYGFDESALD